MPSPPALNPRMLGQSFRAERLGLGLTQQSPAQSAGIRRQTFVDLEAGRNVSLHTLLTALAAMGQALAIVDARMDLDQLHLLLDAPDED